MKVNPIIMLRYLATALFIPILQYVTRRSETKTRPSTTRTYCTNMCEKLTFRRMIVLEHDVSEAVDRDAFRSYVVVCM